MVSRYAQEQINSTSGEYPLTLLEINHSGLTAPARVCDGGEDIVSQGHTYTACPFRFVPPDQFEGQAPRAQLAIDNVGEELTQWLESSGGGRGATVTIRQAMRATPNVIEFETTMDLSNLNMTWLEVTGELGFEDLFQGPAVGQRYTRQTAPGLFK